MTLAQMEQVLRRAAELERVHEDEGTVSVEELERLGEDVGLPREAIQRALREVELGALVPTKKKSLSDLVLGARQEVLRRTVPGQVAAVQDKIAAFMRGQLFQVRRDAPERTVWGPAPGLINELRRLADVGGHYELATGCELAVTVLPATPATEDRVDVIVVVRHNRGLTMSLVASTLVLAAGGALLLFSAVPWAAAFPFAGSMGALGLGRWTVAHRRTTVVEPVERLLDRLEHPGR